MLPETRRLEWSWMNHENLEERGFPPSGCRIRPGWVWRGTWWEQGLGWERGSGGEQGPGVWWGQGSGQERKDWDEAEDRDLEENKDWRGSGSGRVPPSDFSIHRLDVGSDCLDPIWYPLDIQFHVHRDTLCRFPGIPRENTRSNALLWNIFCNISKSGPESQLSRSVLSVSMTAKQDWHHCWLPPNLANVSKPIHARQENAAGRFYDSGRVQWQHRHNRGDYQCTGVNGQDYQHHTLGYHYHRSLDKAITIHHPRSGLLGGLQLQPSFITWKEFKNKWNIFKWYIWISLNL